VSGGTPAAAPFAEAWSVVPTTTAGRRAARAVVFGAELDINGFNPGLPCCNDQWASWMGAEEALRGAFVQRPNGRWSTDLVSAASATSAGVSYTIKANANWYWGGRKVPVTYKDFVYTLQQIDNPYTLADRTGYANLDPAHFTHRGAKQVSFLWKRTDCSADFPCGPYGNWQSLFSKLYPSFALRGLNFDRIWTSCICGSDGKPVADGPYYLANYTHGEGSVLKANPYWGGRRPRVREIDFRILSDRNAEIDAMRRAEVDAIWPAFGLDLEPLRNMTGMTFDEIPGYYVEHLEFREGKGASNALLRAPFIRLAIAMAIDRQAIIDAVYGDLADLTPLNSALYYSTESGYRPDFKEWSYNPKKALALMAKHCTGGPKAVDPATTSFWQCSGLPATFYWSWPSGDTARTVTEAEAKAELRAIGIQVNDQPLPPNTFFGAAGLASGVYDIAEFADITGGDPGEWADTYRCSAAVNYTGFCSRKVDSLLAAGARETDLTKRTSDYRRADVALSSEMPVLPMYQRPDVLVHVSALRGMIASPGPGGPFWNVQDWTWKP